MEVFSEYGGTIYLKGVSYANYADNKWSLLTEEQEAFFGCNFACSCYFSCADKAKDGFETA